MFTRDTLLKDLRHGVLDVTFTKVNGEERKMRCTLVPALLPEIYRTSLEEQESEKNYHKNNPDVIACWDVQARGWRSFRIDSVIYTQAIDSY